MIAFDDVPNRDTEPELTAEEIERRQDAEARRKWERNESGVDVSAHAGIYAGGGPP